MPRSEQDNRSHDANLARFWSALATGAGGHVFAQGADRGAVTGLPLSLFNPAIISTGQAQDLAALHRQMDEATKAAGTKSVWWLGINAQRRAVTDALLDLGYIAAGSLPAMEYTLGNLAPSTLPAGMSILTLTDADDRSAAGVGLCRAYGFDDKFADAYSKIERGLPPEGLAGTERYVMMHDGTAVSYATLVMTGEIAGIYAVATPQKARGRGYGRVITEYCMHRAQTLGARRIVLQASEMGLPVYERIGFVTVGEYLWYAPEDD